MWIASPEPATGWDRRADPLTTTNAAVAARLAVAAYRVFAGSLRAVPSNPSSITQSKAAVDTPTRARRSIRSSSGRATRPLDDRRRRAARDRPDRISDCDQPQLRRRSRDRRVVEELRARQDHRTRADGPITCITTPVRLQLLDAPGRLHAVADNTLDEISHRPRVRERAQL